MVALGALSGVATNLTLVGQILTVVRLAVAVVALVLIELVLCRRRKGERKESRATGQQLARSLHSSLWTAAVPCCSVLRCCLTLFILLVFIVFIDRDIINELCSWFFALFLLANLLVLLLVFLLLLGGGG